MNRSCLLFLTVLISYATHCNAQITYEKGYYIDNSGQKIDCYIKNVDWENNPIKFDFKTTEQSEKQTLALESVKEFSIYNVSKYIRSVVKIDKSSNSTSLLSNDKNPIFEEEKLFLKVLIESEASLFSYKDKRLLRYFYKINDDGINQLVYKEYVTSNAIIKENTDFRRQLYENLKCDAISMDDVKNLDYKKTELLNFFLKYNNCKEIEFTNFEDKVKPDLFNLNIRPGINSSSLSINNNVLFSTASTDYGNALTFRTGLEFEFILGFNKNKWAIIIEPTYQYFKAEGPNDTNSRNTDADYQSVELPIGLRHYFFLNDNSKCFVNTSVIYDFVFNSSVRNLEVKSDINMAFGIGYNYKKRYSLELRYQNRRDLLTSFPSWNSDYQTTSLIFGYTLF